MVYDAKIARNFYFQPGLYFTSLGGKIENEEGMLMMTADRRLPGSGIGTSTSA